ncbi:MAG: diguanylate cyclase domain-containing protein [Huintestinicola sp.]
MAVDNMKIIGICLCRLQNDIQTEFADSVAKQCYKCGYKAVFYNSFTDFYLNNTYDKGEAQIFDHINYDILDGMIVLTETLKTKSIAEKIVADSKAHGLPVAIINGVWEGCCNIVYDFSKAFGIITDHIIEEHGCRTINMVAGIKGNDLSEERVESFRRSLRAHGIEPDENRILYGDFWADPTEKAFEEFLATGLPIGDAFVCANDSMAMTICAKLAEHGLRVPDDVIVTGFDGIYAERFHIPRLTTAKQNTELAGIKAVEAMTRMFEQGQICETISVDHKVVFSQSCRCRPIDFSESAGLISEMFIKIDHSEEYDDFMSSFCREALDRFDASSLSECIRSKSNPFHWNYISIVVDDEFMTMSKNYEDLLTAYESDQLSSNERRMLVLMEHDRTDTCYKPYYTETGIPLRLHDAFRENTAFFVWSVHFQGNYIGRAITALSGGYDGKPANNNYKHLEKYSTNLNHVLEIANSQAVQKKVIAKLRDLYIRDHVTGLYNRRGFYSSIIQSITDAQNSKDDVCYLTVISMDMDGLKDINDSFGHAEGDFALKTIAEAMKTCWGENEICARFGGDEFMLASIGTSDPGASSSEILHKIREYIDNANNSCGKPYTIQCSFGTYSKPITDDLFVDDIIKIADDLMYQDKSRHKAAKYRSSAR